MIVAAKARRLNSPGFLWNAHMDDEVCPDSRLWSETGVLGLGGHCEKY
jgi:hypothetical protein